MLCGLRGERTQKSVFAAVAAVDRIPACLASAGSALARAGDALELFALNDGHRFAHAFVAASVIELRNVVQLFARLAAVLALVNGDGFGDVGIDFRKGILKVKHV